MRTAPAFARAARAVVRTALWFCASNLLVAVLAAQCSNPTQVPNQTITSGTVNFSDNNALAASNVVISGSASVTFVAGNCIHLQPGFHATAGTAGTTFHAWVETAPTAVSFFPSGGSGLTQQFTLAGSSPSGYSNLSEIYGLFNTSVSGVNACYIRYHRAANLLYLADNAGSTWLGGFVPGSAGSASNSQCSINGNGSSFSAAGTQLAVTVAVTFQTAFAGPKNEYLNVYNNEGLYSTWQQMGTWTVPGPDFTLSTPQDTYSIVTGVVATPAYTLTVTPINGFSGPVSFSVTPFYGCWNAFFSPASVAGPPWTTTLTMSCYEQYPNTYVTTVQANGGGILRTLPLYLRITATQQYSLTTTVNPPGGGSLTLTPPGGWYNSGTPVQVLAAPAAGYTFTGFTGNLTGTALPQALVMNANKSVTANFTATPPGQYSLTTSVNAAGAGTISPGAGSYISGSQVQVTATAAQGYTFARFTGDQTGTANPQTVVLDRNKSVTAEFVLSGSLIVSCSATPTPTSVGQTVTFVATVSGGSPP